MINPPVSKRKVLLVDDEPLTLTIMSQALRKAGYDTAEARSGQQALDLAFAFQPDLVVLDVVMAGMSGIEVAKQLHADTTIPFMFISASAEADIVRQATEYGAVGYLLKPFDVAQVVPAFEAALGRADEIKRLRQSEATLTASLNAGRETSMAVGVLMAKFDTNRDAAFEGLRAYARSNRCKINDVARNLLAAEELFNNFKSMFSK